MLTKACEFSSSQLTSISLYNWHSDLSNKSKKIRNIFLVFDHCCFPRVSYYDYVAWSARYIVGIIFLKKCSGNKSSYKQKVESRSCKNNSLWISNARFLKKNIDNLEEKKIEWHMSFTELSIDFCFITDDRIDIDIRHIVVLIILYFAI